MPDDFDPRQSVYSRLYLLERAWRDGSPTAVLDALHFCWGHKRPPPDWLLTAVQDSISKQLSRRDRRNFHSDQIHYTRWDAVVEARERFGMTWPDAYAAVSELLKGTLAEGSEETIKSSYRLVQKDMRGGSAGRFYISPVVKVG
jgi:hypothetical protein